MHGCLKLSSPLVGLVLNAPHTFLGHVGFEDPLALVSLLLPPESIWPVLERDQRDRPVRVVCKSYGTWALA
jgi:hypothetical protein